MFKKILHFIVSFPWIYNQVQIIFGANKRKKVIQNQCAAVPEDSWVLDLGGGTGLYRDLWPKDCRYICLDNDLIKLKGFTKSCPNNFMLLANAQKIPIKNNSMDFILCNSMAHHIPEAGLEHLLSESSRILQDSGKFLFLEPVVRETSLLSHFIWSLDRGEHPHTPEALTSLMERYFVVNHFEEFTYVNDFVFYVCHRKVNVLATSN